MIFCNHSRLIRMQRTVPAAFICALCARALFAAAGIPDTSLWGFQYLNKYDGKRFSHLIAVLSGDCKAAYPARFHDSKSEFDERDISAQLRDTLAREATAALEVTYLIDYRVIISRYDFGRKGFDVRYPRLQFPHQDENQSCAQIDDQLYVSTKLVRGLKPKVLDFGVPISGPNSNMANFGAPGVVPKRDGASAFGAPSAGSRSDNGQSLSFVDSNALCSYFLAIEDEKIARPIAEWNWPPADGTRGTHVFLSLRFTGEFCRTSDPRKRYPLIKPLDIYLVDRQLKVTYKMPFNPHGVDAGGAAK